MRDLNLEFQDNSRQYAYDFDDILRDYMLRSFRPFISGNSGLEMGCFEGNFTKRLYPLYKKFSVLDGSSELLKKAEKNSSKEVHFHQGRFENHQFEEKFDDIFLIHALEHCDDPVETLSQVRKWLAPKGRFFLVVPNANAPSRQIAVKMGLISHNCAVTPAEYEHGHRVTYSHDTLERDVRKSGFKIMNKSGIFFKPLANFQFDQMMKHNLLGKEYFDGCYEFGMLYPDLCASLFFLCENPE